VPPCLDRRDFRWLVVNDIFAIEMAEKALHRHQHCREVQAHAEHYSRLGVEYAAQQIPSPGGGDAERTGQIRCEQHMRKAHPEHRTE
jgi:hypothetical protein